MRVFHAVYALLSYVYQYMKYTMMNVRQIYIPEMTQMFTIILSNCALTDDWLVMPETCRSLCIRKHYCDFGEVCAIVGSHCNNCITMHGMGKCKIQKNEA
jgi:hypothetical protein